MIRAILLFALMQTSILSASSDSEGRCLPFAHAKIDPILCPYVKELVVSAHQHGVFIPPDRIYALAHVSFSAQRSIFFDSGELVASSYKYVPADVTKLPWYTIAVHTVRANFVMQQNIWAFRACMYAELLHVLFDVKPASWLRYDLDKVTHKNLSSSLTDIFTAVRANQVAHKFGKFETKYDDRIRPPVTIIPVTSPEILPAALRIRAIVPDIHIALWSPTSSGLGSPGSNLGSP